MDNVTPQPSQPAQYIITPSKALDADTTWKLLTFEEQLGLLYHDFKNEILVVEDEEEHWKAPEGTSPLLNDIGINYIISSLRDTTSPSAMMGNISKEEAYKKAKDTCDSIAINLFLRQDEFELKTINIYSIMPKVRNIVGLSLSRLIEGKERELHHQSTSVTRTYVETGEEKKGGLTSGLFSLFKLNR